MTAHICTRCERRQTSSLRRGLCRNCYERARQLVDWQSQHVDATAVRAHLIALRAAGLGLRQIAETSGVARSNLQAILGGVPHRGQPPRTHVLAATATAILAVAAPSRTPGGVEAAEMAGGVLVDALGSCRRLRALIADGHTRDELAQSVGVGRCTITGVVDGTRTTITATTATRIATRFDELAMTPGPSTTARAEGAAAGWPMPLDYDDDQFDDPTADVVRSAATVTAAQRHRRYISGVCIDCGTVPHSAGRPRCETCHRTWATTAGARLCDTCRHPLDLHGPGFCDAPVTGPTGRLGSCPCPANRKDDV